MRWLIAALVFCLLNVPVRAEDCVASRVRHGKFVRNLEPKPRAASLFLNDNVVTAAHKSLPLVPQ